MFDTVARHFKSLIPAVDFCSLRLVEEQNERIQVRQGVLQPVVDETDVGAMITVMHDGGLGYAATSDVSQSGLSAAIDRARTWAKRTAGNAVFDYGTVSMPHPTGSYESSVTRPWDSMSLADKIDLLRRENERLSAHDSIVDWGATLWRARHHTLYVTSGGGHVEQTIHMLAPNMSVTANEGTNTQTRSMGFYGESQQGGLEVLDRIDFTSRAENLAEEAVTLLNAPNCPSGAMDLVLAPDQMLLQIHESIGHPLELDRILGDERNYAGTSFVTLDMFGSYQYGSELLDVTYDPTRSEELASYAFDDDGVQAEKTYIIRKGILEKPLGSAISQSRAGMSGVANSRATSWNRPPIDRMANLNVEAGSETFDELIGRVERGVYMQTNCSWSIDDSRNKFQFGCEMGRIIEDGELKGVVRNPNYRGVSATFWRSLSGLGNEATVKVCGSPFCGKGEPSQIIRVGHAAPVALFSNIDVFGGE